MVQARMQPRRTEGASARSDTLLVAYKRATTWCRCSVAAGRCSAGDRLRSRDLTALENSGMEVGEWKSVRGREGERKGERRNRLILMPRGVHLARSLGWSAERQVKELHFLSLPLSLHIRIGRPQNPLSAMRINHMHRADSCLFE